jgi:hypothetical protein
MAEKWVNYRDLAGALGVSKEAARLRAIRHGWPRKADAQGGTLVLVDSQAEIAAEPALKTNHQANRQKRMLAEVRRVATYILSPEFQERMAILRQRHETSGRTISLTEIAKVLRLPRWWLEMTGTVALTPEISNLVPPELLASVNRQHRNQ